MLILLHGTDRDKKQARLRELLKSDAIERMNSETFDGGKLAQLASGTSLFGGEETIVLTSILENTEAADFIIAKVADLVSSQNKFILAEEKLLKKDLKPFEKNKATIEEYSLPLKNKKEKEGFNMFSLTDALGARDKKQLWILFQQAIADNVSAEEIHGILWWQIKNMSMVAKEQKNPGLHPFVYGKTQNFVKKYSPEELENIGNQLVHVFHEARRGKADLGRETEKLVLSL